MYLALELPGSKEYWLSAHALGLFGDDCALLGCARGPNVCENPGKLELDAQMQQASFSSWLAFPQASNCGINLAVRVFDSA